jgi:hypothetical protein
MINLSNLSQQQIPYVGPKHQLQMIMTKSMCPLVHKWNQNWKKKKSKSVLKEDLETKKKKVLEAGANGDAVKVCDLFNIVCNSPKVFEFHCNGQKRRSMVKKQEENPGGSAMADYAAAPGVVLGQMTAGLQLRAKFVGDCVIGKFQLHLCRFVV